MQLKSIVSVPVLPKYEVTVQMPNYVLIDAEEVNATVCAR